MINIDIYYYGVYIRNNKYYYEYDDDEEEEDYKYNSINYKFNLDNHECFTKRELLILFLLEKLTRFIVQNIAMDDLYNRKIVLNDYMNKKERGRLIKKYIDICEELIKNKKDLKKLKIYNILTKINKDINNSNDFLNTYLGHLHLLNKDKDNAIKYYLKSKCYHRVIKLYYYGKRWDKMIDEFIKHKISLEYLTQYIYHEKNKVINREDMIFKTKFNRNFLGAFVTNNNDIHLLRKAKEIMEFKDDHKKHNLEYHIILNKIKHLDEL